MIYKNYKKILIPISIAIIILTFKAFTRPKETLINETMRFCIPKEFNVEDYEDDTDFGVLANKKIEAKVDIKITQYILANYVDGQIKIGNYVFNTTGGRVNGERQLIYVPLIREDEKRVYVVYSAILYISYDLKHMLLYIKDGDYKGTWSNASTLGDYKTAMKIF